MYIIDAIFNNIQDTLLLFFCIYTFFKSAVAYDKTHKNNTNDTYRLKITELLMFLSLLYVLVESMYIVAYKYAYIFDNIAFTIALFIVNKAINNIIKKQKKLNKNKSNEFPKRQR